MYDLQAIEFEIDHVVVVVGDLVEASDRIFRVSGLNSLEGGRHPGHGTENRIIPLGPNYIELLTVADSTEADSSEFGRWVTERVRRGAPGIDLVCLRTSDLDEAVGRFGVDPLAMSRRLPDGSTLSWRIAGLDAALGFAGVPFFIQWESVTSHPGRMATNHRVATNGISSVDISRGEAEVNIDGNAVDVSDILEEAFTG